MATAARKLDIKNHLLLKTTCLGNSDRVLMDVCSELLTQYCRTEKDIAEFAQRASLRPQTIERMRDLSESETGRRYRPAADTCERILREFGAEMYFNQVAISKRHANKPKTEQE